MWSLASRTYSERFRFENKLKLLRHARHVFEHKYEPQRYHSILDAAAARSLVQAFGDVPPPIHASALGRHVAKQGRTSASVGRVITDGIFSGRGSLRDQSGRGFDRDLRLAGAIFRSSKKLPKVDSVEDTRCRMSKKCLIFLVPGERIELPTNGLQNRCSTAELTRRFNNLAFSRLFQDL